MKYTQDQIVKTLTRSLKNVETIRPESRQKFANVLYNLLNKHGILMLFYSGYRDYPTQWEYRKRYLAGTGGIAAAPGWSWHNFRRAIDGVAVNEDGSLAWESKNPVWNTIISVVKAQGLTSGESYGDKPHMSDRIGTTKEAERTKFPGWEPFKILETGLKKKDTEFVKPTEKWEIPNWIPWAVGGAAALWIGSQVFKAYRR